MPTEAIVQTSSSSLNQLSRTEMADSSQSRRRAALSSADFTKSPPERQSEQQVVAQVKDVLAPRLADYTVETGRNLFYKVEIDGLGRLSHDSGDIPMRGQLAFQTDILISKNSVPLVVIELKSGSFSSHDVITYSWKAERHKRIYPYLRYGFVVVGPETLGRRFSIHNEDFDFALALPDLAAIDAELAPLVQRQIMSAERLIALRETRSGKLRRYEETVEIDQ
jgi:hypothetical protein